MKVDLSLLKKARSFWLNVKPTLQYIKDKYNRFTGTVFVVSDLHALHTDKEAIETLFENIEKTKGNKLFVAAGDWVTFDLFSRFTILEAIHYTSDEIEFCREILKGLIKFGDVIYLKSNHEKRLDKAIFRKLDKDQAEFVMKSISDWLTRDYAELKSIQLVDNWWIRIGNIVVAHPEGSSAIKGRMADSTAEGFASRMDDIKVVFTAHTHRQVKVFYKDILAIETGCMCGTQDYAIKGKVGNMWRNPQYLGYGVAKMVNGKADINSCDFVHIKIEDKML